MRAIVGSPGSGGSGNGFSAAAARGHVYATYMAAWMANNGEGTKKDWNDLLKEHLDWNGEPEKAPLGAEAFEEYHYNGKLILAESAYQKAKLMVARKPAMSSFDFRHGNRLWWCKVRYEKNDDGEPRQSIDVEEIANCAFKLLYRERDEVADETNYFLQVDFPTAQPTVKARFSSAACANSGEFKKRLMAFAGMWSGTGEQLDRIMRNQTRDLKVVEPISFTGYSRPHRAWVLGDIAVRDGRLITVNKESYFDLDRKSTRLNSSHTDISRMPSSA